MNRDISRYFVMVESADMKPAASAQQAVHQACIALQKNLETWRKLNEENIPATNKQLEVFHSAALPIARLAQPFSCN
jgi:hypothetical protein